MQQHLAHAEPPVQHADRRVHETARAEVCAREHNHAQAVREHERRQHADQAWRILLVPWRRIDREERRAGKRQKHACHNG